MSREIEERIATGMVAFWRDRVRHLPGHVIHEVDGVVVCLTGLDDDEQNTALIKREPLDPVDAFAEAEEVFRSHGQSLGVDVERDRHPDVDAALRAMGLEMVATRPAMAARVQDVEPAQLPEGVEIVRVTEPGQLLELVEVEIGGFETDRAVAEGLLTVAALAPARPALRGAHGRPRGRAGRNEHSARCRRRGRRGDASRAPPSRDRNGDHGIRNRRRPRRSRSRVAPVDGDGTTAVRADGFPTSIRLGRVGTSLRRRPTALVYSGVVAVLGGEPAVPCTRNPLQRG